MIKSFKCKETEKIWNEKRSKKFPPSIQTRALRKLRLLDSSESLKISKFFGLSERYWINLQSDYDLRMAKHKIFSELSNIHTIHEIQSA